MHGYNWFSGNPGWQNTLCYKISENDLVKDLMLHLFGKRPYASHIRSFAKLTFSLRRHIRCFAILKSLNNVT